MMREIEDYMNFWPEYEPDRVVQNGDYCFVYRNKKVMAEAFTEKIMMPTYEAVKKWIGQPQRLWYLGKWKEKPCFAYELTLPEDEGDQVKEGREKLNPRGLAESRACTSQEMLQQGGLDWVTYQDPRWNEALELHFVAIKAQHLLNWDKSTQFCGYCGHPYHRKEDERAKVCEKCGSIQYPRISPAVIVGIKRGEQMLLAHNSGFKEGLYSTIAGFVEQGETLENAVRREIYEEVGIKVKHIRYFQSRPWISLDSLMLGFIAEYESGEIKVDGKEIVDAGWYDKAHLPPLLPEKITTAWCLINEILGLEEKVNNI